MGRYKDDIKYQTYQKQYNKTYQKENRITPQRRMYFSSIYRAQESGMEHTITVDDIILPERCPYLDIPFDEGSRWFAHSLDRIDNTKGYTPDNIQVISYMANSMKQNASLEQLIIFAQNVLKLHNNGFI